MRYGYTVTKARKRKSLGARHADKLDAAGWLTPGRYLPHGDLKELLGSRSLTDYRKDIHFLKAALIKRGFRLTLEKGGGYMVESSEA